MEICAGMYMETHVTLQEKQDIANIILFGSIARENYDKNSDIDIFIDTKNKNMEKKSEKILLDFYKSIKFSKYWSLLGIKNEISLKVGELDKWDLKESIMSNGIVLYGRYASKAGTKQYALFELKIKGDRKDKIKAWRKLYGYKQTVNKKAYESSGLIKKFNGKKVGKAAFIAPIEYAPPIIKYFRENKIVYSMQYIWSADVI